MNIRDFFQKYKSLTDPKHLSSVFTSEVYIQCLFLLLCLIASDGRSIFPTTYGMCITTSTVLTACISRVSTLRSKAVRFMLSNTSDRVCPRPCSTWTISPEYFFRALLMKRSRCFWFIQDEAWMCVSTWRPKGHSSIVIDQIIRFFMWRPLIKLTNFNEIFVWTADLPDVVEITVRDFLLCCQLFHLV